MGAGHAGDARAGGGSVAGGIVRSAFTLRTTVTYHGINQTSKIAMVAKSLS